MRTISDNLKKRLEAQVEEAKFQGLDKVASQVEKQVKISEVRKDLEEYVYSKESLSSDIQDLLWKAAIRTQDYYGKTADVKDIANIVNAYSDDLISAIRTKIGGDVIGPYEPIVPGEQRMIVEIEEDND